jgi:hypothetical protein
MAQVEEGLNLDPGFHRNPGLPSSVTDGHMGSFSPPPPTAARHQRYTYLPDETDEGHENNKLWKILAYTLESVFKILAMIVFIISVVLTFYYYGLLVPVSQ